MRSRFATRAGLAAAITAAIGLAGCSDAPKESPLLQAVPADTPYVLDSPKPLPDPLFAKLMAASHAQLAQAERDIAKALKELDKAEAEGAQKGEMDPAAVRAMLTTSQAIVAELSANFTVEGLPRMGFPAKPRSVVYGIGPFPVMRLEVADPALVEQTLARIEANAGQAAEKVGSGDQAYRRIAVGEDLALIMAVRDKQLIVALVPGQSPDLLAMALGEQAPAKRLVDTDKLAQIRKKYGYTGYGDGYVDLQSLLNWFTNRGTGPAADALAGLMAGVPQPEPGCLQLADSLVAGMPRIVIGVTDVTDNTYAVSSVHEATPGVAAIIKAMAPAKPLPGMGNGNNAMLSAGMDLDMPGVRKAIKTLGRFVAEQGRSCSKVDSEKLLADLPKVDFMLGPMLGGVSGIYVQLSDVTLDPQTSMPTAASGGILLAAEDPQALMAMAGMMNPALAQIELPADGSAVAVPPGMLPPEAGNMYLAAGQGLLALTLGDAGADTAASLLKASRSKEPLLFSLGYDSASFAKLMEAGLMVSAARAEAEGNAEQATMLREQAEGMTRGAEMFGHIDMWVGPTADGIKAYQTVELK